MKLFCIFTIGVVVSIFVINNSNSLEQEEIRTFINSKISIVKSNDYDNKNDVFNNSLKRNFKDFVFIEKMKDCCNTLYLCCNIFLPKSCFVFILYKSQCDSF